MLLRDSGGVSLELKVLDWQFPEAPHADDFDPKIAAHDSGEWLMISVDVHGSEYGPWSFVDPSLMFHEARNLARWMNRLADAGRGGVQFDVDMLGVDFLEPVVAFRLQGVEAEVFTIVAEFGLEGRPPGLPSSEDCRAPLRVTRDQLRRAAADIHRELDVLPR